MGYSKITLHSNQVCDYLFASSSPVDADLLTEISSTEPKEWTDGTLMLAKFNNKSLVAGDSSLTDKITGYSGYQLETSFFKS